MFFILFLLFFYFVFMESKLYIKSSKQKLLFAYIKFIEKLGNLLKISVSVTALPSTVSKISVFRSPHVHKKAKDHFEIRNFKFLLTLKGSNCLIFIKEILKVKPLEVAVKLIIN